MVIIWRSKAGRQYPQWQAQGALGSALAWRSLGTIAAPAPPAIQHDTWRQQFTILRRMTQQFEF